MLWVGDFISSVMEVSEDDISVKQDMELGKIWLPPQ